MWKAKLKTRWLTLVSLIKIIINGILGIVLHAPKIGSIACLILSKMLNCQGKTEAGVPIHRISLKLGPRWFLVKYHYKTSLKEVRKFSKPNPETLT